MATNERLATRHRIPKLSDKPEPGTGRYYASYRSSNGTARRQRFTRDRMESQQMYRRWVIEQHDDHADIVLRDGSSFKGDLERAAIPQIGMEVLKASGFAMDFEVGQVRGGLFWP